MNTLLYALLLFAGAAVADTLTPVSPPFDWTAVFVALAVGAAAVGAVWYLREHPGAAKKAKEELAHLQAELAAEVEKLKKHNPPVPAPVSVDAMPAPTSPLITAQPSYPNLGAFLAFVAAYDGAVSFDGAQLKVASRQPPVSYLSSVNGIVKFP